jgi:hypothetical protein
MWIGGEPETAVRDARRRCRRATILSLVDDVSLGVFGRSCYGVERVRDGVVG